MLSYVILSYLILSYLIYLSIYLSVHPGSPVDQTIPGWSFGIIRWVARIPDPTNWHLVDLDFLGFLNPPVGSEMWAPKIPPKIRPFWAEIWEPQTEGLGINFCHFAVPYPSNILVEQSAGRSPPFCWQAALKIGQAGIGTKVRERLRTEICWNIKKRSPLVVPWVISEKHPHFFRGLFNKPLFWITTVDGRDPAPPGMYKTL